MTIRRCLGVLWVLAAGCASINEGAESAPKNGSVPGTPGSTPSSAGAGGASVTMGADPTAVISTGETVDGQGRAIGGQITAGTWDDNVNFGFYSAYLSATRQSELAGTPAIERSHRMIISVWGADGRPVAGANVRVTDAQDHTWTSLTGGEGRVIYFPEWAGVTVGTPLTVAATVGQLQGTTTALAGDTTADVVLEAAGLPGITGLDLAFVLDTTGSMADELSYLQAELDPIVGGIAAQFPSLAQRWALIVYRDTDDEYVVRGSEFTSTLSAFKSELGKQASAGGGDMPEAVDQALTRMAELGWRGENTARVAFWIADAPHHVGRETQVVSALAKAVAKGIHVYPVAASGTDDLAEFAMRTAAQVTGGRYLFLTDDSGIGGDHAEPHIPCYYVTTLASAMQRMVATEVTGTYVAPAASDIIRTSGSPVNQQCELPNRDPVAIW